MNQSYSFYFLRTMVFVTLAFLYLPIILLIVFSFNNNAFTQEWQGFTMQWYGALWDSREIWDAFSNSCLIAVKATILSVTLATLFIAFAHPYYKEKLQLLFYASLAVPEILIAVSLLRFFGLFGIPLGAMTILIGHTLLGLGYSIPIIYTRYQEIDQQLILAARDLGASQLQVFRTIILPLLFPAIVGSSLLIFIISLDDFFISFFCADATTQTLPLYIFSVIRSGSTPMINALSTVLLCITSIAIFFFSLLQIKPEEN
jgi:spermidine/putrescine transport system permease protein